MEKREFLRIKVSLPLKYDMVAPDHLQEAKEAILSGAPLLGSAETEASRFWRGADLGEKMDEQFSQIAQYFRQVDAKLDYLIGLAEGNEPPRKVPSSVSLFDISGAGLSFIGPDSIPQDSYLNIHIQLNRFPLIEVIALSQVIRCLPVDGDSPQGRFEIGLAFIAMHKDSRERIFHFISRIERKMLRDRKEAMNP